MAKKAKATAKKPKAKATRGKPAAKAAKDKPARKPAAGAKKPAKGAAAKPTAATTKFAKAATSTRAASAPSAPKATSPTSTKPTSPKASAKKPSPKATAKPAEIMVSVTMWEPVMPLDRGERYEDPLFELLEAAGLGGAGDGGGTLTGKAGEIEQIDFDVSITSLDAIPLITKQLEAAGAPIGSVLRYEAADGDDVHVTFGAAEGIAVYLDGISQPAEIYASTSAQELVDRVLAASPTAELRGSWQGPEETALYLYGPSAEQMWTALEPVLRDYPLSRNARVVLRHGNPANRPVEIRLTA